MEPDIEVETMDLILPLILNGLGIGFLPDLYVKDLLKSNQIQEIRMEEKYLPGKSVLWKTILSAGSCSGDTEKNVVKRKWNYIKIT